MIPLFLVVTALVLAVLSALFSGVETALFSLKPFQIRRLTDKDPRFAEALGRLMSEPGKLLGAILFADALVNLPLILLCLFLTRRLFAAIAPLWIVVLVTFALVALLCDLAPKLLALRQPLRLAKAGIVVMRLIFPVINPVLGILQKTSDRVVDLLTPPKFKPHRTLDEGELETFVQLSEEEGALHGAESRMIREILKLGDKTVKDCMTPRIRMLAIPDDLSNEEAVRRLKAGRHRRVPVYADTPDNILGILDARTFLVNPSPPYTEVMIPPSFVPETMKALNLLKSFLTHKQGMAVIVDEFGGTEGIVTLADLVEEILSEAAPVGGRGSSSIVRLDGGRVVADGATRLDDLKEFGFELEEPGIDTLGGLIFKHLGYLPASGARLKINRAILTVRQVSGKRIEEVLVVDANEQGRGGGAI